MMNDEKDAQRLSPLKPFLRILFAALALFELLQLNLFTYLPFALTPPCLALCNPSHRADAIRCVPYAASVLTISAKKLSGRVKRDAVLCGEGACGLCTV